MLKHKGTQELCTERLRLRRYDISDAGNMFKNYSSDARVTKFLSWKPYENVKDVENYLAAVVDKYAFPNVYHWAIETNGEIIGSISVMSVDEKNHNCEIGYCIGHDYWSKGITSETLSAVMTFLFNEVGMHRIFAKHDVENPASGKVMQKCSMTYEGRLREHYLRHDGTYSDALVYSILRKEYA